jgi:RNA polymerase sigma factor (sigma-70 family)
MSIAQAVEVVRNSVDSFLIDEAWKKILGFAEWRCKVHSGCRCPDDTDCEHRILDVAQDACVYLHMHVHEIRNPGASAGFIDEVCRTKVLDQLRRRAREKRGGNALHLQYSERTDAEDETERNISLQVAEAGHTSRPEVRFEFDLQCLVESHQLDEQEMQIALEHFENGKSQDEIAAAFGLSKSTAHRKLRGIASVLQRVL